MSTVTSKGQVTIPKRVREQFGIEPGTRLEFAIEGNALRLRKVGEREAVARWRGTLELPGTVDELLDDLRGDG